MSQRTFQLSQDLLRTIEEEAPKLSAMPESVAATRASGGEGWSRKQEIGHLLDSATNNRVRFATAAINGTYTGPNYDGDAWVKAGNYQSMEWKALVDLWAANNKALATLIANIPHEKLAAHCEISGPPAVTLGFLIEDYILHMQHHLDHLLGREASTSYPGANMGV